MLEFPHQFVLFAIVDGLVLMGCVVEHLAEAVHVELADKRGHIAMLEVALEQLDKLGVVGLQGKNVVRLPPDDVLVPYILEHGVQF